MAEWHINADEIPLFDYNDDERTADEASFERESSALPLYSADEFRTSDHDPILIGLDLEYEFEGFFAPVADSSVKAGRTIPVRFGLGGDFGLNVVASGYPKVELFACGSDDVVATVDAASVRRQSLSYDAETGEYVYLWKTDASWVGSCARFVLRLVDDTTHTVEVRFAR